MDQKLLVVYLLVSLLTGAGIASFIIERVFGEEN